jgi:excisionase family DNA binding protein
MPIAAHHHIPPNASDSAIARESGQRLAQFANRNEPLTLRVAGGTAAGPIELPAVAVHLLMEILENMAAGRGVTIMPQEAELTTVQAADILNVSRPFLIKLLEGREIPYRTVGKHRRVRTEDVMAYKARFDREREKALDDLVADAQEQKMGY